MPVRDPLALALALALVAGPLGALLVRRGRRLGGALLAAALAGLAVALAAGGGAAEVVGAAVAGALCALALPGRARVRGGFGGGFARAGFGGAIGEARLPVRLAAAAPSRLVDPADALRLERAILDVEAKAEAELAVALVRRSGAYGTAAWRAAAWLAALGLAAAAAFGLPARGALAAAAAGAVLGHGAARSSRLRRLLVSEASLGAHAEARALDAFARAGLGRAPGHAGLLVFASLFEGRVLVLADRGLRAPADAWHAIARDAAGGLAVPPASDGLARALERAGALGAALHPRQAPASPDGRPPPISVED